MVGVPVPGRLVPKGAQAVVDVFDISVRERFRRCAGAMRSVQREGCVFEPLQAIFEDG